MGSFQTARTQFEREEGRIPTRFGYSLSLHTRDEQGRKLWRAWCRFCRQRTEYVPGDASTWSWCCPRAQAANARPQPDRPGRRRGSKWRHRIPRFARE